MDCYPWHTATEARIGNQETELGWSLKKDRTTETGKRAVPRQRGKQLKAARESDHLIVLRDGRADHMGKGVTVIGSLQRQLAPDRVGPEPVEPTFLQAISMKAESAKAHRFQNLYSSLNEALLYKARSNLNKQGAPWSRQGDSRSVCRASWRQHQAAG